MSGWSKASSGIWFFEPWRELGVVAGITGRDWAGGELLPGRAAVSARQVHGAGIAFAEGSIAEWPGCDALVGGRELLTIRTADCVPVFLCGPGGSLALAHAGWRGIALRLPARAAGALMQRYHVAPAGIRAVMGPAIHSCCYEVGEDFEKVFPRAVQRRGGKRYCDLIGEVRRQLESAGLDPRNIEDSGHCTHCEAEHWFSYRREGERAGRMVSFLGPAEGGRR